MSSENDENSVFNTGASDQEIEELKSALPVALPTRWIAVLKKSNGFEANYPAANPPFQVLSAHQICSIIARLEEEGHQFAAQKSVVPIAVDYESGFYVLDTATQTAEGECAVVRISPYSKKEEFRYATILEFLESNLDEEDFQRFSNEANSSASQDNAAFIRAARQGHAKKVTHLLTAGVDVNYVDEYGDTALIWAAMRGHIKIVRSLLIQGADVNKCGSGGPALTEAARMGNVEIVLLLLENKAGIEAPGWKGTALCEAVDGKHTEVALALLAHGANPNVTDRFSRTPLLAATCNGDPELVSALLARGADMSSADALGYTALDWAQERKYDRIKDILLQA